MLRVREKNIYTVNSNVTLASFSGSLLLLGQVESLAENEASVTPTAAPLVALHFGCLLVQQQS